MPPPTANSVKSLTFGHPTISTAMDSKEGLEALFKHATEGILVTDHEGTIVKINPAAERMFGYEPGELPGLKIETLIPNRFADKHKSYRTDFTEHPHPRQMGIGMDLYGKLKSGGELPVEVSLSPFSTSDGKFFVIAFIIDITIRKKSEQALRLQKEELEKLAARLRESNSELENFAYISSHDLQEPLRKIQSFGDRLRTMDGANISEQGLDYLDRMLNAASRMQRLINDLLTFSRLTSTGKAFSNVNLDQVLQGVLGDLEVMIERTGSKVIADKLPVIEADPTQMRQLFQNLIQNGIKFRKEGQPAVIEIKSDKENGQVILSFKDNGIGFDEKYTDRIFNIFQRLNAKSYEGSGIGLAICRKIATRHGGTIKARSHPGEGATFIVRLPEMQQINH